MNADAFRELFRYHFAINRKIWDQCIVPLTQEQFLQDTSYSVGSVRNQLVHMMDIDNIWFQDIRGEAFSGYVDPEQYSDRALLREEWDRIEASMQSYLDALQDQDLFRSIEIDGGDGKPLTFALWQGLIHVVNHGTDHRAQLLALLNSLGQPTIPQDFASFFWNQM